MNISRKVKFTFKPNHVSFAFPTDLHVQIQNKYHVKIKENIVLGQSRGKSLIQIKENIRK